MCDLVSYMFLDERKREAEFYKSRGLPLPQSGTRHASNSSSEYTNFVQGEYRARGSPLIGTFSY